MKTVTKFKNVKLLSGVPAGTKFKAVLYDRVIEGKVKEDGDKDLYLSYKDEEGKNSRWSIGLGSVQDLDENDIDSLQIPEDIFPIKYPVIRVGDYDITITPGFVRVGCQSIPNELVKTFVKFAKQIPEGASGIVYQYKGIPLIISEKGIVANDEGFNLSAKKLQFIVEKLIPSNVK